MSHAVVHGNRRYDFLRYGWLAGNRNVIEFSDFAVPEPAGWVDEKVNCLSTLHDWLHLTFEGVHVGRFVIASVLRAHRVAQLDFADPTRLCVEQVRLAERHAYGGFFWRPLRLLCVSLEYPRVKTTPKVTVRCRSRQQWLGSPDMRRLAEWIADGKAEDMPGSPS